MRIPLYIYMCVMLFLYHQSPQDRDGKNFHQYLMNSFGDVVKTDNTILLS